MIESLREGVLVIDAPAGSWCSSNSSVERILDVDPPATPNGFRRWDEIDALVGRRHPDQLDNSSARHVIETGEPLLDQSSRARAPTASERWVAVNYLPLGALEGRGRHELVVSFDDITDERRVTEDLRRSEQQLRSVISSAPIILSTFDLDGTTRWSRDAVSRRSG